MLLVPDVASNRNPRGISPYPTLRWVSVYAGVHSPCVSRYILRGNRGSRMGFKRDFAKKELAVVGIVWGFEMGMIPDIFFFWSVNFTAFLRLFLRMIY